MPSPKDPEKYKEYIRKQRKAHLNRHHSKKTRLKMSKARKKWLKHNEISEQTRTKIGKKHKWKTQSEETRKKIAKHFLNKNLEQIHGKRKAQLIKKKKSINLKGKTHEQIYGKEEAERRRKSFSEKWKGRQDLKGKQNPAYVHGLGNYPYPVGWRAISRKIINQNPICWICKSKIKLVTHHINYNPNDLSLSNLITLCDSCNKKVNSPRNYWFAFFCYHLGIEPEDLVK